MADAQQLLWVRLPNGQVKGPFPKQKVKESMRAGRIPEGSAIAAEALGPWQAIGQVPSGAVSPAQPPPQPRAPAEQVESPSDPEERVAEADTGPEAPSDSSQSALPVALIKKVPLWRIVLAFAVAGMSDLIGGLFTLVPPIYIPLDLATGAAIWFALGRPVLVLAVLVLEAIPGVGLVPLWTLVVAMIVFMGKLPGRSGAAAAKGDAASQVVGALAELAGDMAAPKASGGSKRKRSK